MIKIVNLKKKKLEETPKFKKQKKFHKVIDAEYTNILDASFISQNSNDNSINKSLSNESFCEFSTIIKNYKVEKRKINYYHNNNSNNNKDNKNINNNINNINYFIEKNIFNKSEITSAKNIEKEFNQIISGLTSEIDKLLKATIFFINKGFNEHVRYIFYKCLINYGFPLIEKFNTFYENFISDCNKEKINTPSKMYIEFYTEYIFKILINEKISTKKNNIISEFYFNGENIEIIKNNLNYINIVKENLIKNHYYIQIYLEKNFDNLYKEINLKLNKEFPKAKTVLCKMISNVANECDKNGYLKYKKFIVNDDILFDGLKIKGHLKNNTNLRKMISIKLFGQQFSDKKFNNVIQDYLLQLFSNFKYEK